LSIAIHFLKDMKNDLYRIETKIDQIKSNLKDIEKDIRFLRGKTVW